MRMCPQTTVMMHLVDYHHHGAVPAKIQYLSGLSTVLWVNAFLIGSLVVEQLRICTAMKESVEFIVEKI